MARSHFRQIVRDRAGNVVQNAKVYVYETGTTTAVTDLFTAASGGSAVSGGTLVTNAQGEAEGWLTRPRAVDVKVTDNSDTAYYPSDSGTVKSWSDFTETIEVRPNPATEAVINVKDDYGAVGDGTTDDTAAIQAALDAAKAGYGSTGGTTPPTRCTVYFPPGTYITTALLTLDNAFGVTLKGAGFSMSHQTGRSKILFTGATGGLLRITSGSNIELYGLQFWYDNASFTGHLVDINGNGANGDCAAIRVWGCSTKYGHSSTGTGFAASTFRLNKTIISTIENCHFTGGVNNVYLGPSYVVSTQFEKCTFNFSTWPAAAIALASPDAESLVIRDCTFEARGAIDGAGSACYNFLFENNWCGDASSDAPVTWINGVNNVSVYSCVIRGNRFATTGTGGTHLKLGGNLWIVEHNTFEGGTVYDSTNMGSMRLITIGNMYATPDALFSGAEPPAANYVQIGNTPAGIAATNVLNRLGGRVGFGSQDLTVGPTANELLIVGGDTGSNPVDLPGSQAGVYYQNHNLIVQAPGAFSTDEGKLVAGLAGAKTSSVRWSAAKLGFYNTAPVSKPSISGSRGGNAALASLLTQLAAMGLITDGTSA